MDPKSKEYAYAFREVLKRFFLPATFPFAVEAGSIHAMAALWVPIAIPALVMLSLIVWTTCFGGERVSVPVGEGSLIAELRGIVSMLAALYIALLGVVISTNAPRLDRKPSSPKATVKERVGSEDEPEPVPITHREYLAMFLSWLSWIAIATSIVVPVLNVFVPDGKLNFSFHGDFSFVATCHVLLFVLILYFFSSLLCGSLYIIQHVGWTVASLASSGAQQPSAQQPSAQQPGAQQPGAQQPGAQQPGAQQPSAQQPGAQQPGAQQPGAQQPEKKAK